MGHANVDDSGGLRNRKTIVQGNTMKEAVSDDWEKRERGRDVTFSRKEKAVKRGNVSERELKESDACENTNTKL